MPVVVGPDGTSLDWVETEEPGVADCYCTTLVNYVGYLVEHYVLFRR
jgi:hypothetical protein